MIQLIPCRSILNLSFPSSSYFFILVLGITLWHENTFQLLLLIHFSVALAYCQKTSVGAKHVETLHPLKRRGFC